MNLFYISLLLGVASAASMYDNMRSLVTGQSPDYGGGQYGEVAEKQCYETHETKYKEQCEDYVEKVCYTTQKVQRTVRRLRRKSLLHNTKSTKNSAKITSKKFVTQHKKYKEQCEDYVEKV